MRLKGLKHAEIGMVKDLVKNTRPAVLWVRVEQRMYRDAVREQKDDNHQSEVEQFNHLQHIQPAGIAMSQNMQH